MHRDERGQAIIVIAALAAVLVLALAVAVDAGLLYMSRRSAQDAADAGAIGGASVLQEGGSRDASIAAAQADAQRNLRAGVTSVTVDVDQPPISGRFAGNQSYIQVRVSYVVRGTLNGGRVEAASVAGLSATAPPPPMMALSTSDDEALSLESSAQLTVRGGDSHIASRSSRAAETRSSSEVRIEGGNRLFVAGGASGTGFTPPPVTGAATPSDPLLRILPPDVTGLPVRSCCGSVLAPGIYPGGIELDGSAQATMQPGVYILRGGGIELNGSTTLTGSGVFIYNAPSTYPAAGGSCGPLSFEGSSNWTISAPTSGPYQGVALMQDPACSVTLTTHGSSRGSVTGTMYLPNAGIEMESSSEIIVTGSLLARTIAMNSSSRLDITYDPGRGARPLGRAALAE